MDKNILSLLHEKSNQDFFNDRNPQKYVFAVLKKGTNGRNKT